MPNLLHLTVVGLKIKRSQSNKMDSTRAHDFRRAKPVSTPVLDFSFCNIVSITGRAIWTQII